MRRDDFSIYSTTIIVVASVSGILFILLRFITHTPDNIGMQSFGTYKSISTTHVQEIIIDGSDSGTIDEASQEYAAEEPADISEPENTDNSGEYSEVLGTPYDWPEWLGEEPVDIGSMALEGQYEEENAAQLARIEYHLSVISGGVILAVCSIFTWFMIIKPIKSFVIF